MHNLTTTNLFNHCQEGVVVGLLGSEGYRHRLRSPLKGLVHPANKLLPCSYICPCHSLVIDWEFLLPPVKSDTKKRIHPSQTQTQVQRFGECDVEGVEVHRNLWGIFSTSYWKYPKKKLGSSKGKKGSNQWVSSLTTTNLANHWQEGVVVG